jgi:dihydropteroate synthase
MLRRRADHWTLRSRTLAFGLRPLLMGIVNVTPDSFSDGGKYFDPALAVEHALRLVADGADLLDVGGESTRPYSQPVDAEEELRRVMPVVKALCRFRFPFRSTPRSRPWPVRPLRREPKSSTM